MEITRPRTCNAHPGRCIVLWGGCVSEFTLQLQGGIDSVKINTPPPWKKECEFLAKHFVPFILKVELSGLVCGKENCQGTSYDNTDDCCMLPDGGWIIS